MSKVYKYTFITTFRQHKVTEYIYVRKTITLLDTNVQIHDTPAHDSFVLRYDYIFFDGTGTY